MESGLDLRASEKRRRRIIDFVLCWGVEQQKSRERERARKSFFHMQPFKVILCFLPSRLRWIYSNMRAPCCVCSEDTVRMQKFLNFGARPAKICMHLFDIQKHSSAGRKLCKRLQICPFSMWFYFLVLCALLPRQIEARSREREEEMHVRELIRVYATGSAYWFCKLHIHTFTEVCLLCHRLLLIAADVSLLREPEWANNGGKPSHTE